MEYTVELAVLTHRFLTEEVLVAVAEIGGAASADVGDLRLETTLTVSAEDAPAAAAAAIARILGLVAGDVVAVNVMTTIEADARLEQKLELVGVAEVAELLGVSRQRISQLKSERNDFPAPLAELASGPVWRAGDLSTFAEGWQRKPGRPTKQAAAEAIDEFGQALRKFKDAGRP